MAFIFSSIFSNTLGTPKKRVGLASSKVSIRVPCKAVGYAKVMVMPATIGPTTSIIYIKTH